LEEYVRTAGDLPPMPDDSAIPEDYVYTVRQPLQADNTQIPQNGNLPPESPNNPIPKGD
jgi:hypothetical protein